VGLGETAFAFVLECITITVLVDSRVYGIARHPQYLAGILMDYRLDPDHGPLVGRRFRVGFHRDLLRQHLWGRKEQR
jgi:hypothetical protein